MHLQRRVATDSCVKVQHTLLGVPYGILRKGTATRSSTQAQSRPFARAMAASALLTAKPLVLLRFVT